MTETIVKPVSSRRERRQFIKLAWTLYRDDPLWIPPLVDNQKRLLGYKRHPFYDSADAQTFLAWRNGEPCGRIAAINNRAHTAHLGERIGFFGFFESIDDEEVAHALFDAARDWFAERDIHAMRGPTNPSMNYECGLLVDGFDSSPMFMMTYNPPWYARLIESYGFEKAHDLYAYIGHLDQLPETEGKLGPLADQIQERFDVKVRGMNRSRFIEDVEMFLRLYNNAMVTTWGFVPLPPDEIRDMGLSLKHLLIPEMAVAAEIDGQPVGGILGLPDYNPRIKAINGRLFPFGFIKLLSKKRDLKRIRVLSINVQQEYQRIGVGLVLMRALVPKGLEMGIEDAEFSWVLDSNKLARMGLEKGGATIYKTYRIYDYNTKSEAESVT